VSSCALSILRSIEEQLITKRPENLTVQCHREVASYILNEKRDRLLTLEQSFGVSIFVVPSDTLKAAEVLIERGGERAPPVRKTTTAPIKMDTALVEEEEEEEAPLEEVAEEPAEEERPSAGATADRDEEDGDQRRGRRRRRRGRRGAGRRGRDEQPAAPAGANGSQSGFATGEEEEVEQRPESVARERGSDARRERAREAEQRELPGEDTSERLPLEDRGNGRRGQSEQAGTPQEDDRPKPLDAPAPPQTAAHGQESEQDQHDRSEAEQAARRWAPPQPTVDRSAVARKGGWWQRRGET
jgi:ribonuclease E